MFRIAIFSALVAAGTLVQGGTAQATNICQADTLSCPTTMPIGGYCECHAKGNTQGGTVVSKGTKHAKTNSTAAGCGDHPNAPGCR
jgi:hypothetical protein